MTLYLETYGLALRKSGNTLRITREGRAVREVPIMQVGSVMVSADGVSISGGAIRLCREHDIPIFFLPRYGCGMSVLAPVECVRPERLADQISAHRNPEQVLAISREMVSGKIRNQAAMVRYCRKRRKDHSDCFEACYAAHAAAVEAVLKWLADETPGEDMKRMRGRLFSAEGRAASRYWGAVSELMPEALGFPGRKRKGAADPVNSMLNYGYAVLSARIHQAVLRAGLSTYFSFLHSPQPGRASLVYDLMEELRARAVDRVVIGIIGRGRKPSTNGEGRLEAGDRRFLIEKLEARWGKDNLKRMIDGRVKALVGAIETGVDYVPLLFQSNGRYTGQKG